MCIQRLIVDCIFKMNVEGLEILCSRVAGSGVISLHHTFVKLDSMASHYLLCFFSVANHYISRVMGDTKGLIFFFLSLNKANGCHPQGKVGNAGSRREGMT